MEVGWGGSRSHSHLRQIFFGKSSQNSPKPVLIISFWSSIPCMICILFVNTLLKVVSYYDLSVDPCQGWVSKKKFGWWVGGWGGLYPLLFWIFGIVLTLQRPLQ